MSCRLLPHLRTGRRLALLRSAADILRSAAMVARRAVMDFVVVGGGSAGHQMTSVCSQQRSMDDADVAWTTYIVQ